MSNGANGRNAGAVESGLRGGLWGGGAAGIVTGDPLTALYVAGITALVKGLGRWGRQHQDDDDWRGLLGSVFGALGG